MTPQQRLALVEDANRGTVWPRFNIREFIEDTLGPGRYRPRRPASRAFAPDRPVMFFDVSSVFRPADRAAFARSSYD